MAEPVRKLILDDIEDTLSAIVAGTAADGAIFKHDIQTVERVLRTEDEVATKLGVGGLPWIGFGPMAASRSKHEPGRRRIIMPVLIHFVAAVDGSETIPDYSDENRSLLANEILEDIKTALMFGERTFRGGNAIWTHENEDPAHWTDEAWPRGMMTSSPSPSMLVTGGLIVNVLYEETFQTS